MIKPTDRAIKDYYEHRGRLSQHRVKNEMGVRGAFQYLLEKVAKSHKWTLIPEEALPGKRVHPDGTLKDQFGIPRGHWEAKDTKDDLDHEIQQKIGKGYPLDNIIFEDSRQAVLYRDKREVLRVDITKAAELARLLTIFFDYTPPEIGDFEKAVDEFKARVPELATGLAEIITKAYGKNKKYKAAFDEFFELCQHSLNPNIRKEAVEEMLVQHLLTERLIRTVFSNPEFTRRNVIAVEVEKVIAALTEGSFSREEFLKQLDRFYVAIENAARTIREFHDKQEFLNKVYESFFQGYSVSVADTHGIVYTPQPIVEFMCASVEDVMRNELGIHLGAKGANIIDPCTGTGNFIVNLIRNHIPLRDLERVYHDQLFANEIMLLPYYIASLNIEHAFFEEAKAYAPFKGISFVDTLDLYEVGIGKPYSLGFTEQNTERVERQRRTPIMIVIGNPPYNANQTNENDNNRNRRYKQLEQSVHDTYAHASVASNRNKLHDPFVKFFRWATDRLQGRDGIVCFVTNNSFIEQIAFDGMRKHLIQEFTTIYHLDLHGNVYKNPKLSGTTHNVFGIKVGVGITIAIRNNAQKEKALYYYRVPEEWRKEQKLAWLTKCRSKNGVNWITLKPDVAGNWFQLVHADAFGQNLSLGTKEGKRQSSSAAHSIFNLFSNGVKTNRDDVVQDFDRDQLARRIKHFIKDYNAEVVRYKHEEKRPKTETEFHNWFNYSQINWSRDLKNDVRRGNKARYKDENLRATLYRPYAKMVLYFDPILNEEIYRWAELLPTNSSENENLVICASGIGSSKPFHCMIVNSLPDVHLCGDTQCFAFYAYKGGLMTGRRENITDWALEEFRKRYGGSEEDRGVVVAEQRKKTRGRGKGAEILPADGQDDEPGNPEISKWDIFYYVYGLLHHPGYREKYADNLKRELPRIPFAADFWAFAAAGRKLAALHLDYEKIAVTMPEDEGSAPRRKGRTSRAPLQWTINEDEPLSFRVEKMRLSKDKTELRLNESLTLTGIPAEALEYRLGNRSALEWVIDQYQVKRDKNSGEITSDPNREDDEEYIARLVRQVIEVSLQTVAIVKGLPTEFEGPANG